MKIVEVILWVVVAIAAAIICSFAFSVAGAIIGLFYGPAKLFEMASDKHETLANDEEEDTI